MKEDVTVFPADQQDSVTNVLESIATAHRSSGFLPEETFGKAERKATQRLERYERESRYLRKRPEEFAVLEEVFDKPTLMTLYELMNDGAFAYLNGVVAAGKESRVYWGVTVQGTDVAVKIYLVVAAEFRKRLPYIIGDPRFRKVKRGIRNIVQLWAQKEFRNLKAACDAGVSVPAPLRVRRNVLIMEFIGAGGVPAPLLGQGSVSKRDYAQALHEMVKLYRVARLVHSDLSEFNIFKHKGRLVFFDFGSAVDVKHPMATAFLRRDVENVNRFFLKQGIEVSSVEEVLTRFR